MFTSLLVVGFLDTYVTLDSRKLVLNCGNSSSGALHSLHAVDLADHCAGMQIHDVSFLDKSRAQACGLRTDENRASFWLWAIRHRRWEPCVFRAFQNFIGSQTTVLDIGAWVGPLTLYAGTRARRVVALEPDPTAFCDLAMNVRLNIAPVRVPPLPLEAVWGCVSNVTAEMTLRIHETSSRSLFTDQQLATGRGWTTVTCFSLADAVNRFALEYPLFIKMDTEGWEQVILPSIVDVLMKLQPTLLVSMHLYIRTPSSEELIGIRDTINLFPYRFILDSNKSECHRGIEKPRPLLFNLTSADICTSCDYLLTFQSGGWRRFARPS